METLLSNSQAILYLVIAFCILWLTVFLLWFVYYLIAVSRLTYKVARLVEVKLKWWRAGWQSGKKILNKLFNQGN